MISTKEIDEFTSEIWELDEEQIELTKWIETQINQCFPDLSDLEINDILEDIVSKVKFRLKKRIKLYKGKGLRPIYDFHPFLDDLLIHSEEISSSKLREMKSSIKTMNWVEFESLCMKVLETNGIDKVGITRKIKEGGIDFYGVVTMDKYTSGSILKDLGIRIFGQARHHSGLQKVGPNELKVLKEDCQNFQKGLGMATEVLPKWFVASKSPVVPMFITNTGYTKGADIYAKQEGILTKNGEQIAQDLILQPKYLESMKKF